MAEGGVLLGILWEDVFGWITWQREDQPKKENTLLQSENEPLTPLSPLISGLAEILIAIISSNVSQTGFGRELLPSAII